MYNIIGDVAGQFDALMRLVEAMPKGQVILCGDLVDRGPKSFDVVQWAMQNAKVVKGNHEDMMVDWFYKSERYDPGVWEMNGGNTTMKSYGGYFNSRYEFVFDKGFIPQSHIDFLDALPHEIRTNDGLLVTHAPYIHALGYNNLPTFWNIKEPQKVEGYFNVFGHNSNWGLRKFDDYAICIDTSREKVLTGLHWPSKEIFQVPY